MEWGGGGRWKGVSQPWSGLCVLIITTLISLCLGQPILDLNILVFTLFLFNLSQKRCNRETIENRDSESKKYERFVTKIDLYLRVFIKIE